ncbi:MAG: response regulator [Thermodesulfobacteriota bacterium]
MAKEILIADSDKADQRDFQKIFETTDYRLVFSENGEDALLRIKLFKPDLIIARLDLGEQSGLELCEAIKTNPEFKHIPFILLSNIFEEISERDRKRVRADGIISKPLQEDVVLNLVEQLMEEETIRTREEVISEREREWKSFADIREASSGKKEEFLLDEFGENEEEEIIDLVDVVEEPEQRMSINDFIASAKEEPFGEITPLEFWEKLEEEKPPKEEFVLTPEEKGVELERMELQLEKEAAPKEVTPEEELFEKIELEEILEKVEQLKPSIEREWPSEKEVRFLEEKIPAEERPTEKYFGLEEFEAALQKEVKAKPLEEELQPFPFEELKAEVPKEATPVEMPVEEEKLEELAEEEFPEELLAEVVREEEISFIEEPEEIRPQEGKPQEAIPEEISVEELEEIEVPRVEEERVSPFLRTVDRQMEEVIAKGIREMMEQIVTKLVPEMTQNIVGLTLERIEKMVREIVPDLAEKAIQEEIKRLQKGEKD